MGIDQHTTCTDQRANHVHKSAMIRLFFAIIGYRQFLLPSTSKRERRGCFEIRRT